MEVARGVPVLGIVAAADVAAVEAGSQVHPGVAHGHAREAPARGRPVRMVGDVVAGLARHLAASSCARPSSAVTMPAACVVGMENAKVAPGP